MQVNEIYHFHALNNVCDVDDMCYVDDMHVIVLSLFRCPCFLKYVVFHPLVLVHTYAILLYIYYVLTLFSHIIKLYRPNG